MERFLRWSRGNAPILVLLPLLPFLGSCREASRFALTTVVSPANGGIVTANPPDGPYAADTAVQLTAQAFAGFVFHHWEGDLTGTANPAALTITAAASVTAVFLPDSVVTHALTAAVTPADAGTVAANPPDGPYADGSEVQLTAAPVSGFVFHHWEGDLSGTANPATLTMTAAASVTAVFLSDSVAMYPLTKAVSPEGSGTVMVDPPDGPYPDGTEVMLSAAALPGFLFDHWEGDLTGASNPNSITMTGPIAATAVFVPDSWANTFGGTGSDTAFAIQSTLDGGYIVAGETDSFGAAGTNMYLVKLDALGNREWAKVFGGTGNESANAVRQTADGGYILAGYTNSIGAGGYDFYVVKTSETGALQWAKPYGGAGDDRARDILVGTGGYYVLGFTTSSGNTDMFLLMIDLAGNSLGSKTYGGAGYDAGESIAPANGGGYVLAGNTTSFGATSVDAYLVKVNSGGEVVWSKTFGTAKPDYISAVIQRSSGWGYVLAGNTTSADAGDDEMLLGLTNNDGDAIAVPFGWNKNDHAQAAVAAPDGGHAIAGDTNSFGAGQSDCCLILLNSTASIVWQKTYGGAKDDAAEAVARTPDGGYILAGYTYSFGAGGRDIYVVKTNADGDAPGAPTN